MEDLTQIAESSIKIKKKTTKGRQKIDATKKIEDPTKRQVAFSKRRTGLFKKGAELCVLTGAQVAILTKSPGDRIFTFGYPNVDVVVDRFLGNKDDSFNYNNEEIKNPKETSNLMWFDQPIDGMNLEELEEYLHSLVEFKNNVDRRAHELMRINTNPRFLGVDFGLNNGLSTITPCTRDGINKISVTGCDSRVFCLGVRIVKRRTVQQILNLIPKESVGERFEEALARVRRCVGGGDAKENADSDSDLEIVADNIVVNLRCPMSGSRIKIAGRFKPCAHMGCFDLEVFVEMNQRSRKWQCPICLKNYSLENVIIDPYFTRITSKMRNCGEDMTEIEVKPDGSWRAKSDVDRKSLGDLGQWHSPDGTLCVPMEVESKSKPESLTQVKQEAVSDGHNKGLKLGMKKNKNGFWEVRKPENLHSLSSGNNLPENIISNGHKAIPMSSSATGSGRDGDDTSVNQMGGGQFDYSIANGAGLESLSLNIDTGHVITTNGDADVIVLSDSEDEAENLISSRQMYKNKNPNAEGFPFSSIPLGISDPYPEDPSFVAGGSSCLGLFNTADVDFGVPFWSLPSSNHVGPSLQLFGSDVGPTDAFVDMHQAPVSIPTSMGGGYSLDAETSMGSVALVSEFSLHPSVNGDIGDGLVDNPLAFGGDDPSLQLFLPTRPSEDTNPTELPDQPAMSNGFRNDDWISLSLGGGCGSGSGVHCEPDAVTVPANDLNPKQQPSSKDGALYSLADTASLLLGMGDSITGKTSRKRSNSPFSFPRQKRSVRPRLYLSIESDSGEER